MLLYVATPITENGQNGKTVEENIKQASDLAVELWRRGHAVVCPALNTAFVDQPFNAGMDPKTFYDGDLHIMTMCDAVVFSEDYETSKGAVEEYKFAQEEGIPCFVAPDLPGLDTVEVRSPNQVFWFRRVLGRLMRMHLRKNKDYSPMNIRWTGLPGLATRILDKAGRFANLTGFDLEKGEYRGPKEPKNESKEDTLIDNAVYSVIALLMMQGVWGR